MLKTYSVIFTVILTLILFIGYTTIKSQNREIQALKQNIKTIKSSIKNKLDYNNTMTVIKEVNDEYNRTYGDTNNSDGNHTISLDWLFE